MQNGQKIPNEIKQQMTEEELQRTQVLNFDDFKKITRFEKISSKKSVIIVALIGFFLILIGGSYSVLQSQIEKNKSKNEKSTVQARKEEKDEKGNTVTCTAHTTTGITGLDETMTINYVFEDNKLTSFTKELNLVVPETVPTGDTLLQTFLTALQPYMIQQKGYDISVKQKEKGAVTTTKVDYKTLDVSTIPELNQSNSFFNVIYVANTTKEAVVQDMTTQQGYTCK